MKRSSKMGCLAALAATVMMLMGCSALDEAEDCDLNPELVCYQPECKSGETPLDGECCRPSGDPCTQDSDCCQGYADSKAGLCNTKQLVCK